jgi:hypothetical protein
MTGAATPQPAPDGQQARRHREGKTGLRKYYSVRQPLTQADARAHLRGAKTKGALCSRPDHQARALAYDADQAQDWQTLQAAACKLAEAGYRPLLEPSPAGRGGHLWLIFSALVDASAARSHAHSIAPELAQVTEYWPGPSGVAGWNRVRLPGGRYVAPPDISAWCKLYNTTGRELARDGASAARVLLDYQTPAGLIPTSAPPAADQPPTRDSEPGVTERRPGATCDGRPTVTTIARPQQPKRNRACYGTSQKNTAIYGFSIPRCSLPPGLTGRIR